MYHASNIIELAIADLSTYSEKDLRYLAIYYRLNPSSPNLLSLLANRIFKGRMARMPTDTTYQTQAEVLQAMARGDIGRAEGMALYRTLPAALPQTVNRVQEEECNPPQEFKDCNERDYISQECWSDDFKPDIKIKFLDPDYSKRPNTLCMMIDDFRTMITSDDSDYRAWYPNATNQTNGHPIEAEGYGGSPSRVEKYRKVLTGMYISNQDPGMLQPGTYTAYPLYTNKRVGNAAGTFGVSQVHGQAPGYTLYYIPPIPETTRSRSSSLQKLNVKTAVIAEINRIRDLKGLEPIANSSASIKEMITAYSAKDLVPIIDRVAPNHNNLQTIVDYLSNSTQCTISFKKLASVIDADWEYDNIYCNLAEFKNAATTLNEQGYTVHITNELESDGFRMANMNALDYSLLETYVNLHYAEWLDMVRPIDTSGSMSGDEPLDDETESMSDNDETESMSGDEPVDETESMSEDDEMDTILFTFADQNEYAYLFIHDSETDEWVPATHVYRLQELYDTWSNYETLITHDIENGEFVAPSEIRGTIREMILNSPVAQNALRQWSRNTWV